MEGREVRRALSAAGILFLLAGIAKATEAPPGGEDPGVWTSPRGNPSGQARCRLPAGVAGAVSGIAEWQFRNKSQRRYRSGLAVWASPALAAVDGRPMAFIGGYDQTLHALDLAARERAWFKITNGVISEAPAVGRVEGLPVVFWGSSDRTIYAHRAADGRRLWTQELEPPSSTQDEAEMSAPLLHGGRLYITCFVYDRALTRNRQKAWLYALDQASGRIAWRVEVSQGPVSSPAGIEIGGRLHLFVAARKGLLQAFEAGEGEKAPRRLWTFQMPHEVMGSPVLDDGPGGPLLFLGSKFGNLIAIDARTGRERWQRMAGNWIDNSACVGLAGGERAVFVGSHDYHVYAFRTSDGAELWRRRLGGEVHSAPCHFRQRGKDMVAVASLDNHVYVLDARDGSLITAYATGQPIWDKVAKGDTLWGSPAALESGPEAALVYGSFDDTVYVLPIAGECSLRSMARSAGGLWASLGIVMALFLGVALPLVLLPGRRRARKPAVDAKAKVQEPLAR